MATAQSGASIGAPDQDSGFAAMQELIRMGNGETEEVAEDIHEAVESEAEATAPEVDGNPDEEPAQAETLEDGPDVETDNPEATETPDDAPEKPAKKWAGKYESPEHLERGYQETTAQATQLAQQLAQERQMSQELRAKAELVAPAVPNQCPTFDSLSAEDRAYFEQESARTGQDPQALLYTEWRLRLAQDQQRRQQSQAYLEQVALQRTQAAQELGAYCVANFGNLQDPKNPIVKTLQENPEFWHATQHMAPEAVIKFGKHYADLVAENARLKAKGEATVSAIRKQVQTESKEIRQAKQSGRSEAARVGTTPKISAPPPEKKMSPTDRFLSQHLG